jgi:hypothetical protein
LPASREIRRPSEKSLVCARTHSIIPLIAATAKPEIVRIAIDDRFDTYQRAKILRAVNEWNHVLNGSVRFDVDPAADKEPVWLIVPVLGGRPPPVRGTIFGHALAATQAVQPLGGVVIVYVDRVRGYDLASVMRHELGHALGLGHDPNGRRLPDTRQETSSASTWLPPRQSRRIESCR